MAEKLVPHICVHGGAAAIAFYKQAFDADVLMEMPTPDGKRTLHAHLVIDGGHMMLHDEFPEISRDVMAPPTLGSTSVFLNLNYDKPHEVDAAIAKAAAAGATVIMPASDTFWKARYGRVRDPFGHIWAFNAPLP